jgi:hypothetical protein
MIDTVIIQPGEEAGEPCVYRKPKSGRSDDEVRQGWETV